MKKYVFLLSVIFLSCSYIPPVFRNINFTHFDIEYSKPIYYKLGKKIYYSKDINISRNDKLIYDNSYRDGHVSPDYNYIIVQGEDAVLLYDKNGNKIKEFKNCYFDLIQWGPYSKQILILKKVNKKVQLILYNIPSGSQTVVIKNMKRKNIVYKLNYKKLFYHSLHTLWQGLSKFYFSKDGKKVYIFELGPNHFMRLDFELFVIDLKKRTKLFLTNAPVEAKSLINDIFVYYYTTNFMPSALYFFSFDLKKHIIRHWRAIGRLKKLKSGVLMSKNDDFFQVFILEDEPFTLKDPYAFPVMYNSYFLPGNRYFIMPIDAENYYGYIIYDTQKMIYKQIFKNNFLSLMKRGSRKRSKNMYYFDFQSSYYGPSFYSYFKYIFPITTKDTPTFLKFLLDDGLFLTLKHREVDNILSEKYED